MYKSSFINRFKIDNQSIPILKVAYDAWKMLISISDNIFIEYRIDCHNTDFNPTFKEYFLFFYRPQRYLATSYPLSEA